MPNKEGLLAAHFVGFWTLHSPRSFMPSMLIFLDVEKTKRDMVGRWCPSGSDDYTRTYRAAVARMQGQISRELHDGAGLSTMKDSDIVERMGEFLQERKLLSCDQADAQVGVWGRVMNDFHFCLQAAGSDRVFKHTTVETPLLQKPPGDVVVEPEDPGKELAGDFLIIFTRGRKFARLHLVGKCHWSQVEVHDSVRVEFANPAQYDSRCKFCWPAQLPAAESSSDSQEDSSGADT